MARRRAKFRRVSPDMGWVLAEASLQHSQLVLGRNEPSIEYAMAFDEIDSDEDQVVAKDKADWFVKRVLIDVYASAITVNLSQVDTNRLYGLGLGVMSYPESESLLFFNEDLLSPEGYDRWSRLFRTWIRPVYKEFQVPSATAAGVMNTSTSAPGNYSAGAPFHGPAHIRDDFTVSNAGIRQNESLVIWLSTLQFPGQPWVEGDLLDTKFFLRILLQKRRAA